MNVFRERALRWSLACAILLLGALPVSTWIAGGLSDPGYARRWSEWLYGSLICAGVGMAFAVLSPGLGSRFRESITRLSGWLRRAVSVAPLRTDAFIALACFIVYVVVAQAVLSGRPLLIDEIVQVLQARLYASGHLSIPVEGPRAFFSVLHVVDIGDRAYSQFPPGWPAMLALGSLARAEWLVGPLCGAAAVFVFARLSRRVFADAPLTAACATLLFGFAPFCIFQFASHMSHGPVLLWLLIAVVSLADATSQFRSSSAFLAGWSAACAFAVRPLDATAFIAPAIAWLMYEAVRNARMRKPLIFAALGTVAPLAAVFVVNLQTTGHALEFGYTALWGASHGLGFHAAPWGDAHTPQRGIELLSLYLTRANAYLFESPFPALLLPAAGLMLGPALTRIERFVVTATCIHAGLYFAYWHDGFYLGPRFIVPWVPALILLSVHGVRAIAAQTRSERGRGALVGAALAGIVLVATIGFPSRSAQYRSGLVSMRSDYSREAERAGAKNALVFVRESWGAQLVARAWERGVSRPVTAGLYSMTDACVLEHALSRLELENVEGREAELALAPLVGDSSRLQASTVSPDTTERMLPGSIYDAACTRHVTEDQAGYALYPPFLLDDRSGNVYARDLGARNSELISRFPERQVFLVRRTGVDGSSPLAWDRLR